MSDVIRTFDELRTEQAPSAGGLSPAAAGGLSSAEAGGKGSTLSRLHQAGYPVPEGFVILPAAFAGDDLLPEAWTQVQAHLSGMRRDGKVDAFAVRSSALSEDSAQASFAGEFETVLDARTDEMVRDAIHTVRRSRHSERVQAYSQAQGVEATHEVAVVVQTMVQADISGVLFTADPITGSHGQMTGNFVRGLGDQLVSGETTGQAFTIQRPTGRYQGPAELKPFARRLYTLASRLEKDLRCPQDIEWAIDGDRLYLLQSRPITTLQGYNPATGEWNASLTGDFLWSNVNFGEAVSDVMTPLSWSVLRLILGEWIFLPGYHPVGNIGGRPYLNISVFASVFHALGKSKPAVLEALEGTLYTRLPQEMDIPLLPMSRWSVLANLPGLARLQLRQRRAVKDLPRYLAENPAWCRNTQGLIQQAATKDGLIALWHEDIRPHVTQSVWGVLGSASYSSDYTTPLRRELTDLVGPDDADALISNLSRGSDLLDSLGPLVGLARMAHGEMTREAYLESYGHRGPHEFELSIPRPAEDPEWLDQQLAEFDQFPLDIEALLARQQPDFDAAWGRFQARYPRRAKSMRRRIDEVALRARLREAARSEYVRERWLMRLFALRAGELTGLGEDIFFLTFDEVLDVLAGDDTAMPYIPARRQTYVRYKALPSYPSVIRGRFDPFQWAADPQRRTDLFDSHGPATTVAAGDKGSNAVFGSPGSAGRVEGVVRRLDSPDDGDQLQKGEILVAMQTDIAWTPLFPRAAAIVTDVGAPLSHAAIVARELGIPAVVGCGDATMRLKTGDRVRVDGGRGVVDFVRPTRED